MIAYWVFRLFHGVVGRIPYRLMYTLADVLAWKLEHLIRYRRKTVDNNLKRCFPDYGAYQLQKIRKEVYRNVADILLEGFKTKYITDSELRKRYNFINPEAVQHLFDRGADIMVVAGHFNNWEWGTLGFDQQLPFQSVGVYKPIKNARIERYMAKARTRTGMILCPVKNTRSIALPHPPPPRLFLFIGDQSPSNMEKAIWVNFMGRDTPCLHGAEKYARDLNLPVYFASINRVKRGHYEVVLKVITEKPSEVVPDGITIEYMRLLEMDIRESPGSWLWTHNRWKRAR
jgi:Kdo2-lipid IVA lauroyltransferase/acyltransferase